MTIWDWIRDFRAEAQKQGDEQRHRLSRLHNEAYALRETNPERARALYEEGARLARMLNEPWWVLYYDDWRVTALRCFLRDYRNVLDLAVQNTLEVRKPQYDHCPLRFPIHSSLVFTYLGIDPVGYAEPVQQALDYLEQNLSPVGEDKYMVHGGRREFFVEMGWLDRAEEVARRVLAVADGDDDRTSNCVHHSVFNYCDLCEIAWRRPDFEALAQWSAEGERAARRENLQMELGMLLMWQAVAARKGGNDERGQYLCRRAASRVSRLGMPPTSGYYTALSAFHTLGGDLTTALQVRRRELESIAGRGRLAYECTCRTEIARLLAQLGEPVEEALAAAREAAGKLRRPDRYLEEIERLASRAP
jgi:hypothetical protein